MKMIIEEDTEENLDPYRKKILKSHKFSISVKLQEKKEFVETLNDFVFEISFELMKLINFYQYKRIF